MNSLTLRVGLVLSLILLLSPATRPARAGEVPASTLARFSVFGSLHASDIGTETILGHVGPDMNLPRGIGVQTCYWLPLSPEAAAKYVQNWNPTAHPELGVFHHHAFPPGGADFSPLALNPASAPQQWLIDKSKNAVGAAASGELNLTQKEAAALASSDPVTGWRTILTAREADLFATRPYEIGGKTISPVEELRAILTDDPKIRQEMGPILRASGIFGNGGGAPAIHTWELLTADRHATFTLGAAWTSQAGAGGPDARWQVLDVDYYSSAEYDVSATLYEFWPLTVGGKEGSLVWEDDVLASASVSESGGGMEKMAVGSLFLKEVKDSIRLMKADAGK